MKLLKNGSFIAFKGSYTMLGSSLTWCLSQMRPSPIYRHQWNSLEPWRVPYNSRRFQNTLHKSMYKFMYKRSLEFSGKPQTPLTPSTQCQDVWTSLGISRTFHTLLTNSKCKSFQKIPGPYINPWGGLFEASYDIRPTQTRQTHLGILGPLRHLITTQNMLFSSL